MAQRDQGDLNELIDAAARQASKNPSARVREPAAPVAGGLRKVLAAAVVGGAALLLWSVWENFAPPGGAQVERDLDTAVELARQSVEAARKSNGALPQTLPNASLAAVVGYEPEQDGYRLVASMMGIRITLQRDGTKKVEKQ